MRVANPVHVARDGVEALDWLFPRGLHANGVPCDAPSLTLLDLNLPRGDGLEVLRAIRADDTLRRVPVVMLTASDEETALVRGYDLGSFIRTPVEFVETVGRIGMYWR